MSLPRLCIPSRSRPDGLKQKTLAFLERSGYPKDLIYIFVVSDDLENYQTACPGYQLVVGVPGLKSQRRFISSWLDEDEIYLGLDDDIEGVKTMNKSFLDIIRHAVTVIQTRQTGLFGILPKDDARCFKDDTTQHLAFILGALFVCRNHKDIIFEGPAEVDDYERSVLYFLKYKTVFRYRGAGVQTKYQGTSGGTREGFLQRKREGVLGLIQKYPGLCSYRDKKGEPDLILNWRFKSITD